METELKALFRFIDPANNYYDDYSIKYVPPQSLNRDKVIIVDNYRSRLMNMKHHPFPDKGTDFTYKSIKEFQFEDIICNQIDNHNIYFKKKEFLIEINNVMFVVAMKKICTEYSFPICTNVNETVYRSNKYRWKNLIYEIVDKNEFTELCFPSIDEKIFQNFYNHFDEILKFIGMIETNNRIDD
jgi:hypothetical protein